MTNIESDSLIRPLFCNQKKKREGKKEGRLYALNGNDFFVDLNPDVDRYTCYPCEVTQRQKVPGIELACLLTSPFGRPAKFSNPILHQTALPSRTQTKPRDTIQHGLSPDVIIAFTICLSGTLPAEFRSLFPKRSFLSANV